MITLSYGLKQPEDDDTGDAFFAAMSENMVQLDGHNHDGETSAPLATRQVTAPASAWAASGLVFRQIIQVPEGLEYDTVCIWVRKTTGEAAYPDMERIDASSFYLYTSDAALEYTVNFR